MDRNFGITRCLVWEQRGDKLEDSLGKLVRLDTRRKVVKAGEHVTGSAQILIFTGVRYERWAPQPPTTRLDPTRPKRKRG